MIQARREVVGGRCGEVVSLDGWVQEKGEGRYRPDKEDRAEQSPEGSEVSVVVT